MRAPAAALLAVAVGCSGCAPGARVDGPATNRSDRPAQRRQYAGSSVERVTGVTDGDTITLSGAGRTRLIGVDTPEVYGGAECYGAAASAYTKRVLRIGTRVRVRVGRETHDRYGRTLAYVWLADGAFFNALLAERGYATPLTIAPNDDYARRFLAASRRARAAARGLWSSAACARRNVASLAPRSEATAGGCGRFVSQAAAQGWWERAGRPRGYDGDGDGRVCEHLP